MGDSPANNSQEPSDTIEQMAQILKMTFDAYDEDNSGQLERMEIRRLIDDICKEFGEPVVTDERLDGIISEVDDNGDEEFDFGEFTRIIEPLLKDKLT